MLAQGRPDEPAKYNYHFSTCHGRRADRARGLALVHTAVGKGEAVIVHLVAAETGGFLGSSLPRQADEPAAAPGG